MGRRKGEGDQEKEEQGKGGKEAGMSKVGGEIEREEEVRKRGRKGELHLNQNLF